MPPEPAESDDRELLTRRNREPVLRGFAEFGVDTDALVREFNERLAPLERDSQEEFFLWNTFYVERLPPLSALFVGMATPFGRWEVLDFLAACYPTVGASFREIARYFKLIDPHVQFVVRDDDDAGGLPFVEFRHSLRDRNEFFDEYTTGVFLAHYRVLSHNTLRLAAAHSVRARPEDPAWRARVSECLGCEPHYGARYTRLVFTRDGWDAPLLGADARLRGTLEAHAAELARERSQPRDLGGRVRAVIGPLLRGGEPRIADVAQQLNMTARTLQRRLQDASLGFAALIDQVRLELAHRYLADDSLSIAEVSFALGYSESSAFARAFKRLAGASPVEHREAHRRAPQ